MKICDIREIPGIEKDVLEYMKNKKHEKEAQRFKVWNKATKSGIKASKSGIRPQSLE